MYDKERFMLVIFIGRVSNYIEFMYFKNCMFNKNYKNLCN